MESYVIKYRGGVRAVGLGIASAARDIDADVPSITSGAGAPSEAEPDGSTYLRTDGTNATDSLYQRIAGAWVALDGS